MRLRTFKNGPSKAFSAVVHGGKNDLFSVNDVTFLARFRFSPATRTSYVHPRHLVGFSASGPRHQKRKKLLLAPFLLARRANIAVPRFARVVVPFDRLQPLAVGGKSDLQWQVERGDWRHVSRLRNALGTWSPLLEEPCAEAGSVLASTSSDRRKLAPHRCQKRGACPACARAYSRGRGASLVSLFDTLFEPGRLVGEAPSVLAWHGVFTLPRIVSDYVHELVNDGDVSELRRVVQTLTESVQVAVKSVLGSGAAAVVVWHWWHSSNPLAGEHHVHAHVSVPNIDIPVIDGELQPRSVLKFRGVLDADDLEQLRAAFTKSVCGRHWVRALGLRVSDGLFNVNMSFTTGRAGQHGYRHRLSYDARTALPDLIAATEPRTLGELRRQLRDLDSDPRTVADTVDMVAELYKHPEKVEWFLHACRVWQSVQTLRYTGWLTNVQRKKLGLVADQDDEKEWDRVGTYTLDWVDDGGAHITTWLYGQGDVGQYWHRDHVDLMPAPDAAKKYAWDDKLRPVRRVGPPLAWLQLSGMAPPTSALHVELLQAGD